MKKIIFCCLLLSAIAAFPQAERSAISGDLEKDIVYKKINGIILKLDISTPDGEGPFPTVIYVHGGGLRSGSKAGAEKSSIGRALINAGYSVISVDYRLYPQAHFPDPVDDVVSSIRFIEKNAKKYKVDSKRMVLMGGSSGGYLVSYVGASDLKKIKVAAVVPLWGVYDYPERYQKGMQDRQFIKDSLFWRDFFNVPINGSRELFFDKMREASTTRMIKKDLPPFLLVHGTSDSTINYMQAVHFCERMKAAGNTCDLITVNGGTHSTSTLTKDPGTIPEIIRWLNAALQEPR